MLSVESSVLIWVLGALATLTAGGFSYTYLSNVKNEKKFVLKELNTSEHNHIANTLERLERVIEDLRDKI